MHNLKQQTWRSLLSSPESYISRKAVSLSHRVEELKWLQRLQSANVSRATEIFTYTNPRELRALYELALNCPKNGNALEIGSHLGASSCYIAAGLAQASGRLFCVDTWNNETMPEGEQDTFAIFQQNTNGVRHTITPVRKWSKDLKWTDIQTLLDLVFIDGDHSYVGTKSDFECVKQWMAEDGIIAFHDFSNLSFPGVTRVVGEALASGDWMIVGKVDTLVWIKAAKWESPSWLSNS